MADADIVIKAHALEVWRQLCQGYQVVVPSIVLTIEADYHRLPRHEQPFDITLGQQVTDGTITTWEAEAKELDSIYSNFDRVFGERIHHGEVECLAYLKAHPDEDISFCTADGPAIQSLAMLDMSERGISLEEALRLIGQNRTFSRNERQYTQLFFQDRIEQGQVKRIRGEGLNKSST